MSYLVTIFDSRTKHAEFDVHFIRYKVLNGEMEVVDIYQQSIIRWETCCAQNAESNAPNNHRKDTRIMWFNNMPTSTGAREKIIVLLTII